MPDPLETNAELLHRYHHVKGLFTSAWKRAGKTRNPATRQELSLWAGCLHFTLLQIESKLSERGLTTD